MTGTQSLLSIVKKWKISLNPEYRGFRCANCQKYIRAAGHHNLSYGGYRCSVHLCNACEKKLDLNGSKFDTFKCDKCKKVLYKAFHVWTKKGKILVENHYCKKC